MIFQAGLFVSGLLLLLFPADRLLSGLVQLRSFDCFQSLENSPRTRPWWWVPILWLDPLRGFVGALVLKTALVGAPLDWATTEKAPYAILVAVLGLGVGCQMLTRREPDALLAPIGFVAGIVIAFTPWAVALIGMTMAVAAMMAFRRFHAFFTVGVAMVGILGFALRADPLWLIPSLVVLALPGAVAVVSGRAMEIPCRHDAAAPRRS